MPHVKPQPAEIHQNARHSLKELIQSTVCRPQETCVQRDLDKPQRKVAEGGQRREQGIPGELAKEVMVLLESPKTLRSINKKIKILSHHFYLLLMDITLEIQNWVQF